MEKFFFSFFIFLTILTGASGIQSINLEINSENQFTINEAFSLDIEQAPNNFVEGPPAVLRPDLIVSQVVSTGENLVGHEASFDLLVKNIGFGTFSGGVGVECTLTKPNNQQVTLRPVYENRTIAPNEEVLIRPCSFLLDQAGSHNLKGKVYAQVPQPTANDSQLIIFNVQQPQQITLRADRGYPYDPNQTDYFSWLVNFKFDGDSITKISIKNFLREWKNSQTNPFTSPPLYVPTQALTQDGNTGTNKAWFLGNISPVHPGYNFFNFEYKGFEGDSIIVDSFLTNYFAFYDQNNNYHTIPYYITLSKTGNATFIFDGLTRYYQSTNLNVNVGGTNYDGNAWFSAVPNSTQDQRFPTATNGVHTMYYTNGTVNTNPMIVSLPGRNGLTVQYKLYADNADTGEIYLVLIPQIFNSKYGAHINFDGTDKTEDGSIDVAYYAPNNSDFNGGQAGQFFIARFGVETGGSYLDGADLNPDFDTQVFIDTNTNFVPLFPNNNLSFYTSAAKYNLFNFDGAVKFNIGNDGNNLRNAYNDYGTRFVTLPGYFAIGVPDHAKHGVFVVNKNENESKTFITSETIGTNDFNSFFSAKKEISGIEITQSSLPSLIDLQTTIKIDNVDLVRTFKEKIGAKFDMYFDYISSTNPNDLEGQILSGDMNYTTDLGAGIPNNFTDTGSDDEIFIPFFGELWRVVSTNCIEACTIVLEHV